MGPNFNLNYLSSMFLDIERFETTMTIYVPNWSIDVIIIDLYVYNKY